MASNNNSNIAPPTVADMQAASMKAFLPIFLERERALQRHVVMRMHQQSLEGAFVTRIDSFDTEMVEWTSKLLLKRLQTWLKAYDTHLLNVVRSVRTYVIDGIIEWNPSRDQHVAFEASLPPVVPEPKPEPKSEEKSSEHSADN